MPAPAAVRDHLCEAASVLMHRTKKWSTLKLGRASVEATWHEDGQSSGRAEDRGIASLHLVHGTSFE
jgi:hypothetical protein